MFLFFSSYIFFFFLHQKFLATPTNSLALNEPAIEANIGLAISPAIG